MIQNQNDKVPDPNDVLLFDVPLEQAEHRIVEAMKKAGVSPAIIYAIEKTGLIISEDNEKLITPSDRKRWDDAIKEYYLAG